MKKVNTPAEILSLEDKLLAGKYTPSQVLINLCSLFLSALIYVAVEPRSSLSWAKLVLVFINTVLLGAMSLRLREKMVIAWAAIIACFYVRPRRYVFKIEQSTIRTKYREETDEIR